MGVNLLQYDFLYVPWSVFNFSVTIPVLSSITVFHGLSKAIIYKSGRENWKTQEQNTHYVAFFLFGIRSLHAFLLDFHLYYSWHKTQTPFVVLKGWVGLVHMTALNCPYILVLHVDTRNHQNHLPANKFQEFIWSQSTRDNYL